MTTTTFFIVYAIGVIINAFAAAIIWRDLKEENTLEEVRAAILLFFVFTSFGTWVYGLAYALIMLTKKMIIQKHNDKEEKTNVKPKPITNGKGGKNEND